MSFNLNDYETVKERKIRFYKDFPDARISVSIVNQDLDDKAVVKAEVYTCLEDQKNGCPRGEGFALEIRDKELSKNKYGKDYESVNYSSWLENCEESAVGRALDNAGYASNAKCSKDEIQKAARNTQAIKSSTPSKSGYVCNFGKYKGKDLMLENHSELLNYVKYLNDSAHEKGKDLSPPILEFIAEVERVTSLGKINL